MSDIKVVKQYIKELSLVGPQSPEIFANMPNKPNIEISINIDAKKISDLAYEVVLQIAAVGDHSKLFELKLNYAGICYIEKNSQNENLEEILLVQCPILLFPFCRAIIANLTSDSGFIPLMIDPIDFHLLYEKRKETFTIN